MLITDIKATVDGVTSTLSFGSHAELRDYMLRHGIDSCRCRATIASIPVTDEIEVTVEDLDEIVMRE